MRGQSLSTSTGVKSIEEQMEQSRFELQNMSGSDEILKEMSVEGLAKFTAFQN